MIAEQLPAAVDLVVIIQVAYQQAVIGCHPPALLGQAVAVVIEVDAVFPRKGFETITIQVDGDRRAHALGLIEVGQVVGVGHQAQRVPFDEFIIQETIELADIFFNAGDDAVFLVDQPVANAVEPRLDGFTPLGFNCV